MTKTTKYIVGQAYSVALTAILLPEEKLTSRFALGTNFLSVKVDIERQGQLMPCEAQLLNERQLKEHPGKQFLLIEGVTGRYKIAELLKRELQILLVEPKSDAGILQRNIASNGPRSYMSAMDISVVATRLEGMGFSVENACQQLSWVAGKGKPLGTQRYWQYKRLQGLPVEIQKMVHLGPSDGGIQLNAALHLTNAKRTEDQYKAIIAAAQDRRKRILAEQWDDDKAYIERELKDEVLKEAMGAELGDRPAYVPKKRAKAESETLTTPEITEAEAEVMGISPKADTRKEKAGEPVPEALMSGAEVVSVCGLLRQREGLYIELANCIEGLVKRILSTDEFCDTVEAIFSNGSGSAHRIRRQTQEKIGKALGKGKVDGRRASDKPDAAPAPTPIDKVLA